MEKRFYIEKEDVVENKIKLAGDEFLHLSKVMRLRVGDTVECFYDGSDVFSCTIASIDKNFAMLDVVDVQPCIANPKKKLTLFQALPKLDKLEFISQKVCELGCTEIVPFTSQFTIAKPNQNKNDRLKKIVVSACKQCGRTALLGVSDTITFKQMLSMLDKFDCVVLANETENENTLSTIKGEKVAIIVGSEGGFSMQEIQQIQEAGGKSITLGKRILRAETASIVLSALVLERMGELQ